MKVKHFFSPVLVLTLAALCAIAVMFLFPSSRVHAQYKGNEKHAVALDEAARYVQNFRKNPVAPAVHGGYFGRDIFEQILAQPGAVGIRYYYAATDDGTPTLVLVAVDSTGDDMVKGVVAEHGLPCPPYCPSTTILSK